MKRFLDKVDMFEDILSEIKSGRKRSHWMWFAFPQIKGLGRSEIAQYYAILDKNEAVQFVNHEILGENIKILCEELLKLKENDPEKIFGNIDALKLKSSMTLFYTATNDEIFKKVLDKFYEGKLDENSKV